jgi:Group II intron, maturase-specific domain
VNRCRELKTTLVRYADGLLAMCRADIAAEVYARLRKYLRRKRLTLNEAETRIVDANRESSRFVGFEAGLRRCGRTEWNDTHVEPVRRAIRMIREAIREVLNHRTVWRHGARSIHQLSGTLRGWTNYFHNSNCSMVLGHVHRSTSIWELWSYGRCQ